MAKQDDYIRISLRMPPDLHQKLTERAGPLSLNAFIVTRLTEALKADEFLDYVLTEDAEHHSLFDAQDNMLKNRLISEIANIVTKIFSEKEIDVKYLDIDKKSPHE